MGSSNTGYQIPSICKLYELPLRKICTDVDKGIIPENLRHMLGTENLSPKTQQSPKFKFFGSASSDDTKLKESKETFETSATCKAQKETHAQGTLKDATNSRSSKLLSYLNVSFSPEVEDACSESSNLTLEKELFGQLISELQKTVDSNQEGQNETEKSNKDSELGVQSKGNDSDENSNSSDSSSPKSVFDPDDKDTPILDWILQNGNLFEHRMSDTDDSDGEQKPRADDSPDASTSFKGMGVQDYVNFLTNLSKLNSSIKLEKTFEEQYKQLMIGKSPTEKESREQAHSGKMEWVEYGATTQLEEQNLADGGDRLARRSKSVNNDERKNTTATRPEGVQRSNSERVMTDEEENTQDKFPFLSFLLKNRDA